MEVQIAVSKVSKYAVSESGDTVEVVERPHGGVSVVLADGQSSGKGAKSISNLVSRKVISLLAEGVRDGAAARAASDYLYTHKSGKVSSTLNICSVDLSTKSIVITRNNPAPVIIVQDSNIHSFDDDSQPVGIYRNTRPKIIEIKLDVGIWVFLFSDGLIHAGSRNGTHLDLHSIIRTLLQQEYASPQYVADYLLNQAVQIDQGRPCDDISVVVMQVLNLQGDHTRRMLVRLPI
ncbi:MAG: PP2C family protein-serine/threonine phosphatase [Anaerolineales bacterium]